MRLVNLGSFVFCAVASCGWQNTEVPKFAVGRGGKSGLYLLETVIWNRLRVSANVSGIAAVGVLENRQFKYSTKADRSNPVELLPSAPIAAIPC